MSRIARNAAVAALMLVAGCTVVTPEELASIRNGDVASEADVAKLYSDEIVPYAVENAHPLDEVLGAIDADGFDAACGALGVQASQAFPCTFWVSVEARVASVDTESRSGRVALDLGSADQDVSVLIGPVLLSTAVRDGFPELNYSDYGDQSAYAELSDALNAAVVDGVSNVDWEVGTQVRILGAFASWGAPVGPVEIVPVAVEEQ